MRWFSHMSCCTVSVGSLEVHLRQFCRGFYYGASSRSIRGQSTPQRMFGAWGACATQDGSRRAAASRPPSWPRSNAWLIGQTVLAYHAHCQQENEAQENEAKKSRGISCPTARLMRPGKTPRSLMRVEDWARAEAFSKRTSLQKPASIIA